jgi:hypothetical protein
LCGRVAVSECASGRSDVVEQGTALVSGNSNEY